MRRLMAAVLLIASWLGWLANSARIQRQAIEEIHRPVIAPDGTWSGGIVRYAHHIDIRTASGSNPFGVPEARERATGIGGWMRQELGRDVFDEVAGIRFHATSRGKLEAAGRLPGLRVLEFRSSRAALEDGDKAIIGRLDRLEVLRPWYARLTEAGMSRLADLRCLKKLDFTSATIDEAGLRHLRNLPDLEVLDLGQCPIGGTGLRHLGSLTQVRRLYLTGCKLTDQDLGGLAGMTGLRDLYLPGCPIRDAGLVHLERMPALKSVDLRGTLVTGDGVARLKRARPRLGVRFP